MAVWSEVNLYACREANRLDAEHYKPQYLTYADAVSQGQSLRSITSIIHPTEITRVYESAGIQILLAQNIRHNYLDFSATVYMPNSAKQPLARNRLEYDDVVMTRSGANFGDAAAYKGKPTEIYACADCLILRPRGVLGGYLATYLNTCTGRALLTRGAYGMAQPHIAPNYLYTMHLPRLGETTERQIDELVLKAYALREQSETFYSQAEAVLVKELAFPVFSPIDEFAYERSFKEVQQAGRFDAEYFHPEKQYVLRKLSSMQGHTVSRYFDEVEDIVDPTSSRAGGQAYCYDLTDALRYFLAEDADLAPVASLGSIKKKFQKGDMVISRLRSYLREIAVVDVNAPAECLGSSEFIVLRPKGDTVSPEFLMVYLRSEPIQRILKWCQDGSNHPRFKEKEILALTLPDQTLNVMEKVTQLVRDGIEAYRTSLSLLDQAKHQVEELIESASG